MTAARRRGGTELPRLEVSLGLWQERAPQEALATARCADEMGFPAVWVGEMATYDAFALATAIGVATSAIHLVVGPLAVHVRDPAMIAMGVASVASLTGRTTAVALGTSSPLVVDHWHGRARTRPPIALAEAAAGVRTLLDGARAELDGEVVRTSGYRLRLPAPRSEIIVAAFGPGAIRVAAEHADRLVLNLVDPATASTLVQQLDDAATAAGRRRPRVSVWAPASLSGEADAVAQFRRAVVAYLAAPGYREMFTRAGFGDVVELAGTRPHPRALLAAIPDELVEAVGLVGDDAAVSPRLLEYRAAGVDDVVVLPASTDGDPYGRATLQGLAALRAADAADGSRS